MRRILLFLLTLAVVGCSGSAVHRQAIAADTMARAINRALPVVVDEYERAGRLAIRSVCRTEVPNGCTREALRDALTIHQARWRPVMAAWEATRIAHDGWRVVLERCRAEQADGGEADAGSCGPDLASLASLAMNAANDMRCALRAIDSTLDPIPGALTCGADGGVQ